MTGGIVIDSVMQIPGAWRKEFLNLPENVMNQSALVFVADYGCCCVRSMDQAQSFLNSGLGYDLLNAVREIDELMLFTRRKGERPSEILQ